MADERSDVDQLLDLVAAGDQVAAERLLAIYRKRLKRMVQMRMDLRFRARFDPSDVVQEALILASDRLAQYSQERPAPFYPWIRNIAWEQLLKHHEKHQAGKRATEREQEPRPELSDESFADLANRLAVSQTGPGEKAIKNEVRRRTRAALELLSGGDREILELRYLEQLENSDIAAIVGASEGAVRARHSRAIQRLHHLLKDDSLGT